MILCEFMEKLINSSIVLETCEITRLSEEICESISNIIKYTEAVD